MAKIKLGANFDKAKNTTMAKLTRFTALRDYLKYFDNSLSYLRA